MENSVDLTELKNSGMLEAVEAVGFLIDNTKIPRLEGRYCFSSRGNLFKHVNGRWEIQN